MDRGAWRATVHRVTKSRTRQLKQLSTHAHRTLTGMAPGDECQGAPGLPVTERRGAVFHNLGSSILEDSNIPFYLDNQLWLNH